MGQGTREVVSIETVTHVGFEFVNIHEYNHESQEELDVLTVSALSVPLRKISNARKGQ
jgi:hypothetical protein